MTDKVTMVCPALDNREIQVPPRVVPGHQRMGWIVKQDQSAPLSAQAPTGQDAADSDRPASPATQPPAGRSGGTKPGKE